VSSQQQETIGQRTVKSKKPHRNLMAWQKAMDLAVEIYRITKSFPNEELYGLTRNYGVQRFQGRQILRKVPLGEPHNNSPTSCPTLSAR